MPIEVDPIRVRELVGVITDAIHRLRELGAMPEAEFLADFRNTESAKYLFIVAIASDGALPQFARSSLLARR